MTLKQAEDINIQFTRFKDSIEKAQQTRILLHQKVDTAYYQNKLMLDSLTKAYDSLKRANNKANWYLNEKNEAVKNEVATRREFTANAFLAFVGTGIFVILVTIFNK